MLEVKEKRSRVSKSSAARFLEQLKRRESTMRRGNRLRLLAGLAIISVVLAVLPRCIDKAAHFFDLPESPRIHIHLKTWQWIVMDVAILLMTLPLAMATHKESRADAITQFLDSGRPHQASSGSDLLVWIVVMIAGLGLLQGEFLLIDSLKVVSLRLRLVGVDRQRAASIVATLAAHPAGLSPQELFNPGETVEQFRKVIAYLMAYDWGDISPKGDHIMLLSPARRALRG